MSIKKKIEDNFMVTSVSTYEMNIFKRIESEKPKCRLPECNNRVVSSESSGYCCSHYANILSWLNKRIK